MAPSDVLARPLFTAGTGRSGTTVVGELLDLHPEVARTRPWEVRFLTDAHGLCDLVEARPPQGPLQRLRRRAGDALGRRPAPEAADVDAFEKLVRGRWFRRKSAAGRVIGLYEGIDADVLDRALEGFRERLETDSARAAERLAHELIDPPARALGKRRWVETTPPNALRGDTLLRVFPDGRIIHMVRDGRDTCASIVGRSWGPTTMDGALDFWEERMRRAAQALARAPQDRVLHVRLEDLVNDDREATFRRLLDFAGLEETPELREFFETGMSGRRGHLGRWRGAVEDGRHEEFDERYRQVWERLDAEGVPLPRHPDELAELAGGA